MDEEALAADTSFVTLPSFRYHPSADTAGEIARAKGHKDIAELLKAAEATMQMRMFIVRIL